ncbi:hypothetical protein SBOR_1009 [Sclerotinia borealis F-4128]|uniref:non-specific serine/threonine protein kinase n=1 Tax=Sclerotinia borealis (strain F-4128) TaxID=1432307 RepID=W9CVC2_SCLBF|nr:hypothetical protein SBOR_1009 [Sclerotinia borealis F-4128]
MEEELTQPCKDPSFIPSTYPPPPTTPAFVFRPITDDPGYEATQLLAQADRPGNVNSGLTDEDAAEVVCILHPDSEPARNACSDINKLNPNNTISLEGDTSDLAAQGLFPCDLALRLSANFKDINLGWVFGRNEERCDFLLRGAERKISNQHFRVYLNEHGVLMLEDMSTNGVSVDGTVLRYKQKDDGKPYRHTIQNGSVLALAVSTDKPSNFHFIVRVPQRNEEAQDAFDKNFAHYMRRVREAQIQRGIVVSETRQPLNLFPNAANRGASSSSMIRKRREWKGGPKYNKIDVIGKGAFAVVYRITDKRTGVPFAAKELEKRKFMKNDGVQKIDTEMNIMRKIHHDNVVRFVECIDWGDYLYLVMELVPEGDLTGLVTQCHHLPESAVKAITLQLLSALKYLHTLNVTHRDIKPDNILCQSRNPIHVKLTDFGLSKMVDTEDTFLSTFCGTLLYCAPEVYNEYRQYEPTGQRTNRLHNSAITQQRYDHAVDIWSLAGVLFYSFCGTPPFPLGNTTHYAQLLQKIMTTPLDVRPLQKVDVSDYGISFVIKMLHVHPEHRATIEDLEQSPWLTGNKSDPDETEDEDIEELELPASQLSLLDNPESEGESDDSGADTNKFRDRETSSSFSTNNSDIERFVELESSILSNVGANTLSAENLVGQESYEFIRNTRNDGRLYGEVEADSSALESSGAVPLDQADLPTPIHHIKINHPRQFLEQNGTQPVAKFKARLEAVSAMPKTPPPPPPSNRPRIVTQVTRYVNNGVTQASSLMGAVSQLGHLQMNSPSMSPTEISAPQLLLPAHGQTANTSLRRPREDGWYPTDLPPQKRHKSSRAFDLMIPPETFWDPRDPSTHHRNYPPMSAMEYHRFFKLAESKGEKFQHGYTIFDHAMVSFRSSSKTPSMVTSTSFRAQSEPLAEDTQNHPRLARDERRLSDDASMQQSIASRDSVSITSHAFRPQVAQYPGISSTVNTSTTRNDTTETPTIETEGTTVVDSEIDSAAGNDLVPKRVLAKFSATPDSYLPTIAFNITEAFTSWGRGFCNTIRYTTRDEVRVGVPRYAFKLLLFKNDFYPSDGRYTEEWNKIRGDEEGFRYLISTKSTAGLAINGVSLPSHASNEPLSESKYWGEIRNGDIVTLSVQSSLLLKLKFECFWGMGKYPRKESKFFLYKEPDHIAKVDQACINLQTTVLEERRKQEIEQYKLARELKHQRTKPLGV